MFDMLPPALVLLAGALLIAVLRGRARDAAVLLTPLATLWLIWQVPNGVVFDVAFLDYRIEPLEGSPVACMRSGRRSGTSLPPPTPMRPVRSASVSPAT